MDELAGLQTAELLDRVAVHPSGSRVKVHQLAFQIKDEQPITGGFKDAAVLRFPFRQGRLSSLALGNVLLELLVDRGNLPGPLPDGLGQARLTVDRKVDQAGDQARR